MTGFLTTGVAVFSKKGAETNWLLVRHPNGTWELPKSSVRKGESTVGAAIRSLREDYGNLIEVLEEAGRTSTTKVKDGQKVTEKTIFYLAERKGESMQARGEFEEKWQPYANAYRSLGLKREKEILREANKVLKTLRKK